MPTVYLSADSMPTSIDSMPKLACGYGPLDRVKALPIHRECKGPTHTQRM